MSKPMMVRFYNAGRDAEHEADVRTEITYGPFAQVHFDCGSLIVTESDGMTFTLACGGKSCFHLTRDATKDYTRLCNAYTDVEFFPE